MAKKKKSHLVDAQDRKRLVIVSVFIFFCFCLIIIQFYRLQIIQGEKWNRIASSQHKQVVTEYFMRGTFYSNTTVKKDHPEKSLPFVVEVPKFHLYIDPESIPLQHKKAVVKKFFEFVDISIDQKEKIFSDFYKKSRSRKIFTWLDRNEKNKITAWWLAFAKKEKIARNAIFFIQDYKRSYPFGSLLGQVLHTVQEEKDFYTFQSLPTGGLELYFNDFLKGKLGKRMITRSPRRNIDTGIVIEEPENGADIYLTINHYLQTITEEELAKGVKKVNGRGGWAVMMDPYSGEILAFAQNPCFDVRKYSEYYNQKDMLEHTKLKAIVDAYEPGSIMKPITLAVCLRANEELTKVGRRPLFFPEDKMDTSNGYFPGRSKPIRDGRLHNFLNMNMAVQKSSNVYMARLVERLVYTLGEKWYRNALTELFNFGKPTDIELPGETWGIVPRFGKMHQNNTPEWSAATPFSLAIGYNIMVNSLQMIRAYSIIANGGYEVNPTLLRRIIKKDKDKEIVLKDNTVNFDFSKRNRILSKKSCDLLIDAMKYTTKLGGTSPLGDVMGFSECGKSGTAEKIIDGKYSKDTHISSFIGIVPASKPRFVLMVVVDEPEKKFVPGLGKLQQGGVCAAPIFKEISTRALQYLGVAPDDPFGYSFGDPRRNIEKSDWIREIKALKERYTSWNE